MPNIDNVVFVKQHVMHHVGVWCTSVLLFGCDYAVNPVLGISLLRAASLRKPDICFDPVLSGRDFHIKSLLNLLQYKAWES